VQQEALQTDYYISDFDINQLPEKNPLQQVIDEFINKRHLFNHNKSLRSDSIALLNSRVSKPKLDDFLNSF
jgi:hypothetical protein